MEYYNKRCDEVSDKDSFLAFSAGFSDYMVKLELTESQFIDHFFGPEGNERKFSWLAFHEDEPIGIVLSGIRQFDGERTQRCGGLGVAPEHRGSGVAQALMYLHVQNAKSEGCDRLFLEVINGNDRAIAFYKKLGYEICGNLTYFVLPAEKILARSASKLDQNYLVKEIDFQQLECTRKRFADVHLHWQGDLPYIAALNGCALACFKDDEIIGVVSYKNHNCFLLWVDPAYRRENVASHLLLALHDQSKLDNYRFTIANNPKYEAFCEHIGMQKQNLSQFEMCKYLSK